MDLTERSPKLSGNVLERAMLPKELSSTRTDTDVPPFYHLAAGATVVPPSPSRPPPYPSLVSRALFFGKILEMWDHRGDAS